jgi:hypothetical protein
MHLPLFTLTLLLLATTTPGLCWTQQEIQNLGATGDLKTVTTQWDSLIKPKGDQGKRNDPKSIKNLILTAAEAQNPPNLAAFNNGLLTFIARTNPAIIEGHDLRREGVTAATRNVLATARPDLGADHLISGTSDQETATLVQRYGPTLDLVTLLKKNRDWTASATAAVTHPQTNPYVIREVLNSHQSDAPQTALLQKGLQDPWLLTYIYSTTKTSPVKKAAYQAAQPYFNHIFKQMGSGNSAGARQLIDAATINQQGQRLKAQGDAQRHDQIHRDYGWDGKRIKNPFMFFTGLAELGTSKSEAKKLFSGMEQIDREIAEDQILNENRFTALDAFAFNLWHLRGDFPGGITIENANTRTGLLTNQKQLLLAAQQGDASLQTWIAQNAPLSAQLTHLLAATSRNNNVLAALATRTDALELTRQPILDNLRVNAANSPQILATFFAITPPTVEEINRMVAQGYPENLLEVALRYRSTPEILQAMAKAPWPNLVRRVITQNQSPAILKEAMHLRNQIQLLDPTRANANPDLKEILPDLSPQEINQLTALKNAIIQHPAYGFVHADLNLGQDQSGFWPNPSKEQTDSYTQTLAKIQNDTAYGLSPNEAAQLNFSKAQIEDARIVLDITGTRKIDQDILTAQQTAAAERRKWSSMLGYKKLSPTDPRINNIPKPEREKYLNNDKKSYNYYAYLDDQWKAKWYSYNQGSITYYEKLKQVALGQERAIQTTNSTQRSEIQKNTAELMAKSPSRNQTEIEKIRALTRTDTEKEAEQIESERRQLRETKTRPTQASPATAQNDNLKNLPLPQLEQAYEKLLEEATLARQSWEGRNDLQAMTPAHAQWNLVPSSAKTAPYLDPATQTVNYYAYLKDQWEATYYGKTPGKIGYYQYWIERKKRPTSQEQ